MLYILCPTCGDFLGAKHYIYEKEMDILQKKYDDTDDNLTIARQKLINKLCDRYCCKMRMLTYLDMVYIVK